MINNKRGLSAIIVTLIMILLVIVASGLIWVVIRNVVGSGTEQISTGTACLNVNVEATKVTNSTNGLSYDVTLTRNAGGDTIGGVNLILTNATGTDSFVYDRSGNIPPLATETVTVDTTANAIFNANKVEVVVYFTDASGNDQACSVSSSFDFVSG